MSFTVSVVTRGAQIARRLGMIRTTVYISGQVATRDGRLVAAGRLGVEVDLVCWHPPAAAG